MVQYAAQTVAKARLRQGSPSTGPALEMAREVFAELRDDFGHALVLRTLGEEARVRGDLDTARNQLTWSLKIWTSMRLPGWEARTMRDLALCLTAAGEHVDAGLMRVAALSRFDDLGLREPLSSGPRPAIHSALQIAATLAGDDLAFLVLGRNPPALTSGKGSWS